LFWAKLIGRFISPNTRLLKSMSDKDEVVVESLNDHGPSCNCEDCWWSHDCKVVDEFGIPVEEEKE
jgi:hypothetical protein